MQIMDWRSRAVLSWELSNIIDSGFCVRALRNTMALTGRMSKIFNTDQGSQFTGQDSISELKKNENVVSMNGKGCWMDDLFIERLWRILKYEKNHTNNRLYHYPKNSRRARNHWRCCHRRHVRTRCRY